MERRNLTLALGLLALALSSCSGPSVFNGVTPGSPGATTPGSATLSVTITATPPTPPPAISILSFSATVTGIALAPATGTAINIPLRATTVTVDLTRLQSDSALLASAVAVPAGSYTSVAVSFQNLVLTVCTVTQGTSACVPGSITQIPGVAAAPPVTFSTALSLAAAQQTGVAVNVDLSKAITTSAATPLVTAVSLSAAGAVTASPLPALVTSAPSGALDFVENVSGVVSAVTGQIVTLDTATRGKLVATANSSTVFSPNCSAAMTIACVQVGEVASMDSTLNADGTLTLVEFDPLDTATTARDWVEGTVTATPSSTTQFEMVTNDFVTAPAGSLIGAGVTLGSSVLVNLANVGTFTVDTKGLMVPANRFGGTDASILLPGQTVAVRVTSFTAGSATVPVSVNADMLTLRFTTVAGSVASASPPNTFSVQSLPPFFGATAQEVQLSTVPVATNFDGVIPSGLVVGQTVSIRALFFGPTVQTPFSAAKVRAP